MAPARDDGGDRRCQVRAPPPELLEQLRSLSDPGTPPLSVTCVGVLCSCRRADGSPLSVAERARTFAAMLAAAEERAP